MLGDLRHAHPAPNQQIYERFGLDRTFLHVGSIVFSRGEASVRIESPLAADLGAVLEAMAPR